MFGKDYVIVGMKSGEMRVYGENRESFLSIIQKIVIYDIPVTITSIVPSYKIVKQKE